MAGENTSAILDIIANEKTAVSSLIAGTVIFMAVLLTDGPEILLAAPIILCGLPIIWEAFKSLLWDHEVTADLLVSTAMICAIMIGEMYAAAEVALIMCLGELLEESTINHAKSGIRKIVSMVPETASVVEGDSTRDCPLGDVKLGDVVRIRPGESIPVDGKVVRGSTYVDRSLLNGEPVPEAVNVGDEVSSGTMNMLGSVDVEVTAIGGESTIGKIADLLENADAGKSRIARITDRVAKYIVTAALSMAVVTFLLTNDIIRSVTILVVFCPCAIVLATPTAIMAATSNLSKKGILVKDGGALERMAVVDTFLLDKTGTITTGVVERLAFRSNDSRIVHGEAERLAASVEAMSEHPLGRAIVSGYGGSLCEVTDFESRPGYGVSGTAEGHRVHVGNGRLMRAEEVVGFKETREEACVYMKKGNMVVYVAVDGVCEGYIRLADSVKEGSEESIRGLNCLGLYTVMLTGDSKCVARNVSETTGVSDVVWSCLPDTKLKIVRDMESEHRICMVGDGINDAPSLKRADVGIAMGRNGKSLAIEAADIVFLEDDVTRLPGLYKLSRRTLSTIKVGITFSMTVNIIGTVLAMLGLMGPIAGALVHNVGSLLVIGAAAMLLHYDPWNETKPLGEPAAC